MSMKTQMFAIYRGFLDRYARGRIVLMLLAVTLAIYAYMVFHSIPVVMKYADGMKILDILPTGYSHDYVRQLFASLGEDGRRAYLHRQIPIDMAYPFFFAVTYSLLLAYLLSRTAVPRRLIYIVSAIPIIAGLADYLENIGIIVMINSYPNLTSGWINATRVYSLSKSFATMVFWLLLLATLILIAVKKMLIRRRENNASDLPSPPA